MNEQDPKHQTPEGSSQIAAATGSHEMREPERMQPIHDAPQTGLNPMTTGGPDAQPGTNEVQPARC